MSPIIKKHGFRITALTTVFCLYIVHTTAKQWTTEDALIFEGTSVT